MAQAGVSVTTVWGVKVRAQVAAVVPILQLVELKMSVCAAAAVKVPPVQLKRKFPPPVAGCTALEPKARAAGR